jgi:biotin transport system substrate-specific component
MTTAANSRSLVNAALSGAASGVTIRFLGLAFIGSLLLWVSAKTKVDLFAVPMTMQTLVLFALSAAYGWRLALATVLMYLVQGAVGLPVFAGTPEKGIGLAYMVGTTGGYLAAYPIAALIVGYAADMGWSRNPFKLFGSMLVAEIVILAMGAAWLAVLLGTDKAIAFGVGPFILTDLVKIALASAIVPALWGLVRRS